MGQSASVHIGMTMPVLDSEPDGSVVEVVPLALVVVPSVVVPSVEGFPVVAPSVDGSLGFPVVVPESVPCELLPAPLVVGVPESVVGWPVVVIDPVIVSTAVGLVGVVGFVVDTVVVPSSPQASNNGETSAATLPTLRYRICPS